MLYIAKFTIFKKGKGPILDTREHIRLIEAKDMNECEAELNKTYDEVGYIIDPSTLEISSVLNDKFDKYSN